MLAIVFHLPIHSYSEKRKVIVRTLRHSLLKKFKNMILRLLLAPMINIDRGGELLMRAALVLLMFLRKTTYQNKNLSQQHMNKGIIY
jgi:hypothetical protein